MIPCAAELVVVDRVEEGTAVVEIGERLVSLQLGATVLQAAGVLEGTRWQLCLVAPVPAPADREPSSGSEPASPPAAELHASAPASPLPSFRGRPR